MNSITHARQPQNFAPSLPVSSRASGSRRRRLWELALPCHCPLVGICWSVDALRRLVDKSLGKRVLTDDYELHTGAVSECAQRNRLSELLQHELEQRHVTLIHQFRAAKTTPDLARLWKKTVDQGDIAGGLWAALTHPRCDVTLQEVICRNMHMFQHHAVAHLREDRTEFNALSTAHAGLTQELNKTQERSSRCLMEKSSEIERLNALLVQARALHIRKDSNMAWLAEELAALKASVPDLESSRRLQRKIEQMTFRQTELEAQVSDLRRKLAMSTTPANLERPSNPEEHPNAPEPCGPDTSISAVDLQQKTVLCVGGRSGNVASYRHLVERVGGRFAHHDGGLQDNPSVLDAGLAAADLVICQTGCISHNAYWKVKDFCKRTGKRCVFIENPSTSSLARGLEIITMPKTLKKKLEIDL